MNDRGDEEAVVVVASKFEEDGMVGSGLPDPAIPSRPNLGEDVEDGDLERERGMLDEGVGTRPVPVAVVLAELPSGWSCDGWPPFARADE